MGRLVTIALLLVALAGAATAGLGGVEIEHEDSEKETAAEVAESKPAAEQSTVAPGELQRAPAPEAVEPTSVEEVEMDDLRFGTSELGVAKGVGIRFRNADDVVHDVVGVDEQGGVAFSSSRMEPGGSYLYVTQGVGEIRFACSLHPTVMSGELRVRD